MSPPRIVVFVIVLSMATACFCCMVNAFDHDPTNTDDLYLVTFKDGEKVAGHILRIDSEVIKYRNP